MMYTVNVGYRTDRLYSRTERVLANTKAEAKAIVWAMVLGEHPDAVFTGANARSSKRA